MTQGAISDETGETTLHLSKEHNKHALNPTQFTDSEITVPVWIPDDFLHSQGIDSDSVNFVRMDVEGHEYEIFLGMDDILTSSNNIVIFVELHPNHISRAKLESVVRSMQDSGLELVDAFYDMLLPSRYVFDMDVSSWDDLIEIDQCVQVIARKA